MDFITLDQTIDGIAGRIKFPEEYSQYANLAQQIVQYVAEIKKPDGQRLAGYHEAQLESLRLSLFSPAPLYPDMEIARMTGALELDLAEAGPNDPWVKLVLGGKTPRAAAEAFIKGTKLADAEFRKKLVEGGETAVAASDDTMIVLARKLDPIRRELIKWTEDNVDSVVQRAGEQLGKARFAAFGLSRTASWRSGRPPPGPSCRSRLRAGRRKRPCVVC